MSECGQTLADVREDVRLRDLRISQLERQCDVLARGLDDQRRLYEAIICAQFLMLGLLAQGRDAEREL